MMTRLSNEEQIQKLNREIKIRIGPSPIHGVGVFALYDITKGSRLYADNMPSVFTLAYANFGKLYPEIREMLLERWPQIVNGSAFIYPDARMQAYMNHADEPNYDAINDVLLTDVKKGDEITEDYRKIKGYEEVHTWLDKKTKKPVVK